MTRISICLILIAGGLSGCGPGHNYDQTGIYHRAIRAVLISRGLCRDERDCSRREMILSEGGTFKGGPVHVNVYNVTDPGAVKDIVTAAKAVRSSARVGVKLRITSSKHLDAPYKNVRRAEIE